jgi:hypothetical protein
MISIVSGFIAQCIYNKSVCVNCTKLKGESKMEAIVKLICENNSVMTMSHAFWNAWSQNYVAPIDERQILTFDEADDVVKESIQARKKKSLKLCFVFKVSLQLSRVLAAHNLFEASFWRFLRHISNE